MLTKPENNSYYNQDKVNDPDYFNYTKQIGEFGEKIIQQLIPRAIFHEDDNTAHEYDGEYHKNQILTRFDVKCKSLETIGINGYGVPCVQFPYRHYLKYLDMDPFYIYYVSPNDFKIYYCKLDKDMDTGYHELNKTVGISFYDFKYIKTLSNLERAELEKIIAIKMA